MRDCFEQYLRGETYDHIRMDLLFNIYGIFAPFRSDDMDEKGAGTIAADRGRDGSGFPSAGTGKQTPADGT